MTNDIGDAWYTIPGPENDVVLSTRIRLARNLVNFPFPQRFSHDDGERIQSLVFDAFSHIKDSHRYQALGVKKLDSLGQQVLVERGILQAEYLQNPVSGVVIKADGCLACEINTEDHLRIISLCSGIDTHTVYTAAKSIDEDLQNTLQFAASVDFGYLTCRLNNLGTAMKLSVFVHLPSLSYTNRENQDFVNLCTLAEEQGFSIAPAFATSAQNDDFFSAASGACYQVSTNLCFSQTEEDQIKVFDQIIKSIIDAERIQREKMIDNHPTALRDCVYKALATIKYSRLLTEKEGIDLLFRIKWGKDTGIITGTEDSVLSGLLYRIRDAHIAFVNKTEQFKFEKDINSSEKQRDRLRSLIMQEATENIQIYS